MGERNSCDASDTKRRWLFRAPFQPHQHAVHGRGQSADLVVGIRLRHRAMQLCSRDLVHLATYRVDRGEGSADHHPGRDRHHNQQQRQSDQHHLGDHRGGLEDTDQRPRHQHRAWPVGGLRALRDRHELLAVERSEYLLGLARAQSRHCGFTGDIAA